MFVEATCATCHRFHDVGTRIGPDLETLIDRSPKTLLAAVIDPNRACIDRYVEHVTVTNNGLTHAGMLLEETSNSITLVDLKGETKVVLRKDVDELVFTGRSHMPEGLYAKMSLQQMADLFAFIGGKEAPPRQFVGNRPELVVRGADTAFTLPASAAAIYGTDIRFDAEAGCVTSWTEPSAYVAWDFRNLVMRQVYNVWLEYACADASGDAFAVEVSGGQRIRAKVVATGGSHEYKTVNVGQVTIAAGTHRLIVRPEPTVRGPLMNLRRVKLVPAKPVPPAAALRNTPERVKQGEDGSVQLSATKAEVHGPGVVFESKYGNLGHWYQQEAFGRWSFDVRQAGDFEIHVDWACQDSSAGNRFRILVDDEVVVQAEVPGTGTWDQYRQQKFAKVRLDPGGHVLIFRSDGEIKHALIDLRTVILVPATEEPH
jgi:putative heme-binding domain-containing protein